MIKWRRIEAGEYKSEDDRFLIIKTWNSIYGNHWELRDMSVPNRYKGTYIYSNLLDCKVRAEMLCE